MSGIICSVVSDLYEAGRSVDGEMVYGENIYVMIEFPNGRRMKHFKNFKSHEMKYCDEIGEPYFVNSMDEMYSEAKRLCDRISQYIKNGGILDSVYWTDIDPAYGSEAYESLDKVGYFKDREKKEDDY
jgi:hypothetical protein